MGKMKARDIIEGWPKSHSTSRRGNFQSFRHLIYTPYSDLQLAQMNRRYGIFDEAEYQKELAAIEGAVNECRRREAEFEENERYHQQQQAMVDEWRRPWTDEELYWQMRFLNQGMHR